MDQLYLRLACRLSTGHSHDGGGAVPGILIVTQRGDQLLRYLAGCKQFEINEDDLIVKQWLENHGIKDVPDPDFTYDENGTIGIRIPGQGKPLCISSCY